MKSRGRVTFYNCETGVGSVLVTYVGDVDRGLIAVDELVKVIYDEADRAIGGEVESGVWIYFDVLATNAGTRKAKNIELIAVGDAGVLI